MKAIHLTAAPEMMAAQSNAKKLADELLTIEAQIATLEADQHAAQSRQSDPLADALAIIDGTAPIPGNAAELGRLKARRDAVAAGSRIATERVFLVANDLSAKFMRDQTTRMADSLDKLGNALQSTLDAGKDFEAIRDDAAALGYSYAGAGMPSEIDLGLRDWLEFNLQNVRHLAEELRDRIGTDDAPQRITALTDLEGHAKAGETTTMPGKLARLFIRLGRAEILTPGAAAAAAARLRKAVTE